MNSSDIASKYSALKAQFPRRLRMSDSEFQKIADLYPQDESPEALSYFAVLSAFVLFLTGPAIGYYCFETAKEWATILSKHLPTGEQLDQIPFAKISAALFLFSIPIYLFGGISVIEKLESRVPFARRQKVSKPTLHFKRKSFRFVSFALLICYCGFIVALILLNALLPAITTNTITQGLLTAWAFIPLVVLAFVPTLLVLIVTTGMLAYRRTRRVSDDRADTLPIQVTCQLVGCIHFICHEHLHGPDGSRNRRRAAHLISTIARNVKSMGMGYENSNELDKYYGVRFIKAATAIDNLRLHLLLPAGNSRAKVEQHLLRILNVYLEANFFDLPQHSFTTINLPVESRPMGIFRNLLSLIALVTFLAAPLVIWGTISSIYNVHAEESVKGLLPILYTIWCIVGIVSTSDRFAPEAKALILDVLKVFASKK